MKQREGESWRELAKKMLRPPEDDTNLDYFIALECEGPPVSDMVPKVEPLVVSSYAIPTTQTLSESQRLVPNLGPSMIERIPLPVSSIAGVTNSPAHIPRLSASSESVVSVSQHPDLSSASAAASPASAHVLSTRPLNQVVNEAMRLPIVAFSTVDRSERKDADLEKPFNPDHVGVSKGKKYEKRVEFVIDVEKESGKPRRHAWFVMPNIVAVVFLEQWDQCLKGVNASPALVRQLMNPSG